MDIMEFKSKRIILPLLLIIIITGLLYRFFLGIPVISTISPNTSVITFVGEERTGNKPEIYVYDTRLEKLARWDIPLTEDHIFRGVYGYDVNNQSIFLNVSGDSLLALNMNTNKIKIESLPKPYYFLDFSSDSKSVVFDVDNALIIKNLLDENIQETFDFEGQPNYPDWSPDNQKILITMLKQDEPDAIFLLFPDKQKFEPLREKLDEDNTFARWSPDGEQIAFIHRVNSENYNSLWLTDENGQQARMIFRPPKEDFFQFISELVWSPDGNEIAFASNLENQCKDVWYSLGEPLTECPQSIYIIDINGGGLRRISNRNFAYLSDINWFDTSSTD